MPLFAVSPSGMRNKDSKAREGLTTLFAKLRQSHNLPKLDWHWSTNGASSARATHISALSNSKEILFQAHSMAMEMGSLRGEFDATTPAIVGCFLHHCCCCCDLKISCRLVLSNVAAAAALHFLICLA